MVLEPQHGITQYKRRGCRCGVCRAAASKANKRHGENRRARGVMKADGTEPAHGKSSTYDNYGCRCDPCCAAKSAANKRLWEWRARRRQ